MEHKKYGGGVYRICKTFDFSAAHHLPLMPDGHKCKRLHGHNYEVRVWLETDTLDDKGMVQDFSDLKVFGKWLKSIYDHRCINDVLTGVHPTAENLARHFYEHIRDRFPVVKVRVYETASCFAEYERR